MDGSTKSRKRPCLRRRSIDAAITTYEDGGPHKALSESDEYWASLPQDPFSLILDKLHELIDHVSVAAVCKQWRSSAKAYNQTIQRWRLNTSNANNSNILPMLLIPTALGRDEKLVVYSIPEAKIYKNVVLKAVPFIRRCCGSSHGWLAITDRITDDGRGLVVALVNPLNKALKPIYLPSLVYEKSNERFCFREDYVFKVILSADPALSPNTCVVFAVYGSCLDRKCAFTKLGGEESVWTVTESADWFCDVLFYRAQAYLLTRKGDIASLNVNNHVNKNGHAILKFHRVAQMNAHQAYLAESSKGDLLHIVKVNSFPNCRWQTKSFTVFKLVFDEKDRSALQRVKVSSMGGDAVFIGDNNSVSVLASKFPGCRPNSIYYTDNWIRRLIPLDDDPPRNDMGIFNLENGKIEQHYSPHTNWKTPVWVVPPFDGIGM